jgi:hypothetical protein
MPPYPLGHATAGGVDSSPAACPRAHPRRAFAGDPLSAIVELQVLPRRSPPLRRSRAALHRAAHPTRHPAPRHAPHAPTCTAAPQVVGPPRTRTPSGGAGGRGCRRAGAPVGGSPAGGRWAGGRVHGGDRRGWQVRGAGGRGASGQRRRSEGVKPPVGGCAGGRAGCWREGRRAPFLRALVRQRRVHVPCVVSRVAVGPRIFLSGNVHCDCLRLGAGVGGRGLCYTHRVLPTHAKNFMRHP